MNVTTSHMSHSTDLSRPLAAVLQYRRNQGGQQVRSDRAVLDL